MSTVAVTTMASELSSVDLSSSVKILWSVWSGVARTEPTSLIHTVDIRAVGLSTGSTTPTRKLNNSCLTF